MNRRELLRVTGAGIGGRILPLQSYPDQEESKPNHTMGGKLPDRDVDTEVVTPYAETAGATNPKVDTSSWIIHRFGWRTAASEGPKELKEFLEVPTYEFTIDGQTIQETDSHWGEITRSRTADGWFVRWEYATPPKSPGEYEFNVRMNFERPLQHRDAVGEVTRWSGVVEEQSTYNVVSMSDWPNIGEELTSVATTQLRAETREWDDPDISPIE